MDKIARSARRISTSLIVLYLVGCGALPVGIAPTDDGEGGCGPPSNELYYDPRDGVNSSRDSASHDQERIKRCESFYREAEQQRREALSDDLEEHLSPTQPEGEG